MSSYSTTIRNYVERYRLEKGIDGAIDPHDIAAWALLNGLIKPNQKTVIDLVAADISKAFREEYRTDKFGRRYRAMHAVKQKKGDKQISLWADMDDKTIPQTHFIRSFSQRRQQVVGDCYQLKVDVDVYNDKHTELPQIPLVLDFTEDVRELLMGNDDLNTAA